MATYHLNVRHVSKGKGQSAKAKSDYIDRQDKYSKRLDDLQYSSSGNMPSFAQNNPKEFWQSADIYERANARVCTEIVVALPRELNLEQQKELVADFVKSTIDNDQHKLPYSFAIHNDKENHNPHCHLIYSHRTQDGIERSAEQFFKRANSKQPELGGAMKDRDVNKQEFLQHARTTWRELANQHLEKHGHTARIDERTLAEQGIDREPSRRLNRVEFQAVRELDKELHQINKTIDLADEVIDLQKQLERKEQRERELEQSPEPTQGGFFMNAFNQVVSDELVKKGLKTSVEPQKEKSEQIHEQTEKTPQRAIEEPKTPKKTYSQEEFDNFLVREWLEPSKKLANAAERREELQSEVDTFTKERNRIVDRYEQINEPQGLFGLWETKAQKLEKQQLKGEFEKVKAQQESKLKELSELEDRVTEFKKSTIEPLEKKIEQIRENNPELKMRNERQLNAMKFSGVREWHEEVKQRLAERQQAKQKRELERNQDQGLSLF